jgi:hypothetical protein
MSWTGRTSFVDMPNARSTRALVRRSSASPVSGSRRTLSGTRRVRVISRQARWQLTRQSDLVDQAIQNPVAASYVTGRGYNRDHWQFRMSDDEGALRCVPAGIDISTKAGDPGVRDVWLEAGRPLEG